ncbi:PucR family transcriptional regulator [Sporolactobacillus inulinus]|uniref:PucR family transcriptional regulator n=1 Tax=Sporolactobacillus inulinus TaxID=2078 RepID=UPI0011444999|nr:helix-turn-helix domain-containing protein [Sporolactobacillus inulinus]GEB76289.1 Fis family transcriptional regulator [Sporolactobacillus inulinus]
MIGMHQLKTMYGTSLINDPAQIADPETYLWFKTKDGTVFGIKRARLSESEQKLLHFCFASFSPDALNQTKKQRFWADLLFNNLHPEKCPLTRAYLLYIQLAQFSDRHRNLESAFHSYFDRIYLTTLWKNSKQGIILLKSAPEEPLDELINLISSDFYCNLHLLCMPVDDLSTVHTTYKKNFALFNKSCLLFPERHVVASAHLLAVLAAEALHEQKNSTITQQVKRLRDVPPELLHSVTSYFQHNFNLSKAADELFLHRNTLTYRLDRVYQLTGLDPKHFEDAVILSLLIDLYRYDQWKRSENPD